jgi:hypothetical protein
VVVVTRLLPESKRAGQFGRAAAENATLVGDGELVCLGKFRVARYFAHDGCSSHGRHQHTPNFVGDLEPARRQPTPRLQTGESLHRRTLGTVSSYTLKSFTTATGTATVALHTLLAECLRFHPPMFKPTANRLATREPRRRLCQAP